MKRARTIENSSPATPRTFSQVSARNGRNCQRQTVCEKRVKIVEIESEGCFDGFQKPVPV